MCLSSVLSVQDGSKVVLHCDGYWSTLLCQRRCREYGLGAETTPLLESFPIVVS